MGKVEWHLGSVDWFDEIRGIGSITDKNGDSYLFHYSAIQSKKKWKSITKNRSVKFVKHGGRRRQIIEKIQEL